MHKSDDGLIGFSLDNLANNIASATFDVINGGNVRTADMGGVYSTISYTELAIAD